MDGVLRGLIRRACYFFCLGSAGLGLYKNVTYLGFGAAIGMVPRSTQSFKEVYILKCSVVESSLQ